MGRHSKYPEEFRRESVRLVLTTDKSMAEVSRDLGINYKTLGNWVRAEQARETRDQAPGALIESERAELKRVKKENAELRIEREILRKAAAYFAKVNRPDYSEGSPAWERGWNHGQQTIRTGEVSV
jgi:transposase